MIKRKRLGQHFLTSKSIASKIVSATQITKEDVVYEIGTGKGILTELLCEQAKKVISIDSDKKLYVNAQSSLSKLPNLDLQYGNGFKTNPEFSIFVSNLPYSQSKEAIEYLSSASFSHGTIMVQKEFADKILAKKERRAINILANYTLRINKILNVNKENFFPIPKIDSVVLRIYKKRSLDNDLIRIINKIFSYKRKTISNILKQFGIETLSKKRLDELSVEEIVNLAKEIREK